MEYTHMEKVKYHSPLGKCKLKPQWNITVYLSECVKNIKKKIKNVVIPNDEDAQQLDYSYIAVGNAKFPMVW